MNTLTRHFPNDRISLEEQDAVESFKLGGFFTRNKVATAAANNLGSYLATKVVEFEYFQVIEGLRGKQCSEGAVEQVVVGRQNIITVIIIKFLSCVSECFILEVVRKEL